MMPKRANPVVGEPGEQVVARGLFQRECIDNHYTIIGGGESPSPPKHISWLQMALLKASFSCLRHAAAALPSMPDPATCLS